MAGNALLDPGDRVRQAVLRCRLAGEALLYPGDRIRYPDQKARDVAVVVVLLVPDRRASRAVAAGEGAHVAGDHDAVAGTDPLLVARCALELTLGALADE